MITRAKHIVKRVKGDYRLIAISDIHGHLDRFKGLLKKVKYKPEEDYLVIIGDFVEKGDQVLETIHYVQYLSQFPRCYVLLGNCEWALDAMLNIPELANQITLYLKRVSSNGVVRYLYDHYYKDGHETMLGVQKGMHEQLSKELKFIESLPTTLKFNDFIFVHAGLEPRDNYKECGLSSYLEMQHFLDLGHQLKETVIVGHLPTSNYDPNHINNDIIIDEKKRIISIDGGTGVKMISQLNALIIHSQAGLITYEKQSVQPLPVMEVSEDVEIIHPCDHKISFPNFHVKLIKQGKDFSQCYQEDTNQLLEIKNEFLYKRKGELYCLDDYTDHQVSAKAHDRVKVAGIYGEYAYVIKDQEVGWMKISQLTEVSHG